MKRITLVLLLTILLYPMISTAQDMVGKSLTIEGTNVNVRDDFSLDGKKIFQLNTGDKVTVKARSSGIETIGDKTDYWYEVESKGKRGWIFGAFTSHKLSKRSETLEMTLLGISMGDYYHISFELEGHEGWKNFSAPGSIDFGYAGGENNFSGYVLEGEGEGEGGDMTNPEYMNRKFKVQWTVKMLETWVGDGEMTTVMREVPVILSLELLD